MAQTPSFANIAELFTLNVLTFLSSRFTVVSAPFKVVVQNTNQLTCHSFIGDLYFAIRYKSIGAKCVRLLCRIRLFSFVIHCNLKSLIFLF